MPDVMLFIAYHPGSLPDYEHLLKIDKGRSVHALILCRHPYVTQEAIGRYSGEYDHVLILPDIWYDKNIIRGFGAYFKFHNAFCEWLNMVFPDDRRFTVISDCSAYLPVNALLSTLRKDRRLRRLVSIRRDYDEKVSVRVLATLLVIIYTKCLNLYSVYAHRLLSYLYVKEPRDMIINLVSPYQRCSGDVRPPRDPVPSCNIIKTLPDRAASPKSIIIFYSDRDMGIFKSQQSAEERSGRLRDFFAYLTRTYPGHKIVCKPHPLDQGRVMDGMEGVECVIYRGQLASQMHLHENIDKVTACYSVSSTSLLYSASLGIPSYTIYKYMGYGGDPYLGKWFESDDAKRLPFLFNIKDLEEIGIVDDAHPEPAHGDSENTWHQIMYQEAR